MSEFDCFYNKQLGVYLIPDSLISFVLLNKIVSDIDGWVFEHFKNCWIVGHISQLIGE